MAFASRIAICDPPCGSPVFRTAATASTSPSCENPTTAEPWDIGPGETASLPTKWMSSDGRTVPLARVDWKHERTCFIPRRTFFRSPGQDANLVAPALGQIARPCPSQRVHRSRGSARAGQRPVSGLEPGNGDLSGFSSPLSIRRRAEAIRLPLNGWRDLAEQADAVARGLRSTVFQVVRSLAAVPGN